MNEIEDKVYDNMRHTSGKMVVLRTPRLQWANRLGLYLRLKDKSHLWYGV